MAIGVLEYPFKAYDNDLYPLQIQSLINDPKRLERGIQWLQNFRDPQQIKNHAAEVIQWAFAVATPSRLTAFRPNLEEIFPQLTALVEEARKIGELAQFTWFKPFRLRDGSYFPFSELPKNHDNDSSSPFFFSTLWTMTVFATDWINHTKGHHIQDTTIIIEWRDRIAAEYLSYESERNNNTFFKRLFRMNNEEYTNFSTACQELRKAIPMAIRNGYLPAPTPREPLPTPRNEPSPILQGLRWLGGFLSSCICWLWGLCQK